MSLTPPPPPSCETTAFDALSAHLSATLREQHANPQHILEEALAQLQSSNWHAWHEYARAFSINGASPLAVILLGEATRRWPQNPELKTSLGNALRLSQRTVEAEEVFRGMLRGRIVHEPAALTLAFMLRDEGRVDAACSVALDLWQKQGKGEEASLKAGKFLEECRRPQLAAQVYENALAGGIRAPDLLAAAGNMAMVLAEFELGHERLLAALDTGLDLNHWAGIFTRLSSCQRYANCDHPDFRRFEQAWNNTSLSEQARISAGFALGKARIDIGDFKGAVSILRQANAMQRRRRPWTQASREFTAAQIIFPLPQPLDPIKAYQSIVPVFIVGLPRTGTTLLETMLTRHAQVRGRGEMDWLPFLAFELSARQRVNDPVALRQVAATYLAQLRQDDAPARWYIDKNPHNFRHLGLIARLFPQARIIHCIRERRDTAVSIWCQHFAHQDMDYAYNMGDICAFGSDHDRLMEHWRRNLDLPVFEIEYERLVEQPASMLRQLGDFLGLPEHDRKGAESDQPSSTSTASVWQVRQPVNSGSVGRWRRFAPYLPELLEYFGSA